MSRVSDVNIERVISKFELYIAIKENCFNREVCEDLNVTIFYSDSKQVMIYKTIYMTQKEIVCDSKKYYRNGKINEVFSIIPFKFEENNIIFYPYPQGILNEIEAIRREVHQ